MTVASDPVQRASVLVDGPLPPLDYRIPDALRDQLHVGAAVRIPLRNRIRHGYIASLSPPSAPPDLELRDIADVSELPSLPHDVVQLILFAADYYHAPAGEMLAAALPSTARTARLRYRPHRLADLLELSADEQTAWSVVKTYPQGFTHIALERKLQWTTSKAQRILRQLLNKGVIAPRQSARPKHDAWYRRTDRAPDGLIHTRETALRRLYDALPAEPLRAAVLAAAHPSVHAKLRKLVALDLVAAVPPPGDEPVDVQLPGLTATTAQAAALVQLQAHLDANAFGTFVLHGVTGSGKTEVYLQLIQSAVARGLSALVLVPEIALTPQLGARFRARFGALVATFHSALSAAERRDEWNRVRSGAARIGLGARSALFLPFQRLGVIVVDEEHETSFKQEESPRYHARDLAVYRGHLSGATVVLGSATPSLESHQNATQQRYRRIVLPERVERRPMPQTELIDMTRAKRVGDGVFSEDLVQALQRTISEKQQAILFLNRRGFAPYVFCRDCGLAFRCDDCDVALTLHRRRDVLLCHYCGFERPTPEQCPQCHGLQLEGHGMGTERVQEELGRLVGDVACVRIDRDTVRRRSELHRALERFQRREAQIMIGTQMVAKGHDFPGVTLVGVLAADASLNFPDFRAAERTFQLITQVAGRAGRGDKPGRVLVQSYEREHYAIRCALAHDYDGFSALELQERADLGYPPFGHLALLRFEGSDEDRTRASAEQARAALAGRAQDVTILGPAPAPLHRLRGLWRYQVLLKSRSRSELHRCLAHLPPSDHNVRSIIDVDPVSML